MEKKNNDAIRVFFVTDKSACSGQETLNVINGDCRFLVQ
jgi:hypothetical protein